MRYATTLAAAASLVGSVDAFWRMECPGRVALARIDPLVSPGTASAHAHAIHGSSGFTETSTTSDLLAGDCTSCRVTQDKSAYWHPAMYFEDAKTGKFELVNQVGGMLAYYLLLGDNIKAFPPGFQMMSGDTDRRKYTLGDPTKPDPEKSLWASLGQTKQSDLAQRALGFNCLNYDRLPEGTLDRHIMPEKSFLDANCANGLRIELMFPSCWNGKDVTTENHKDHMAFPDLVMTGNCPKDFPVRVPSLLYETIWDTHAFAGRDGRFVMANGDATGLGYHGDFITGWDSDFLQSAVNTCTNPSGLIGDCPLFNIVSEEKARSCGLKPKGMRIMAEDTKGPMSTLPGNVQITTDKGPEKGSAPAPKLPKKKPNTPSMTYVPGEKASNAAEPVPGQVFRESGVGNEKAAPAKPSPKPSVPAPAPVPAPSDVAIKVAAVPQAPKEPQVEVKEEAPAPTQAPPPPKSEPEQAADIVRTEYITEGNLVSKILWAEEIVTVTESIGATATVTVSGDSAQGRRRRHLLAHGHRHF